MHDKAFELGLFTVNENLCIVVNLEAIETKGSSWATAHLPTAGGCLIRSGAVAPSREALQHHWARVRTPVYG